MAYFRRPKTQNERKQDQAVLHDEDAADLPVRGRVRSAGKEEAPLPSDRSDIVPASRKDRSRGKPSRSKARKAKEKARDDLLK